jgi:hypothetical protein
MLLRYQAGRWTVPLAGGLDPLVRRVLLRSLGARGLAAAGRSDAPGGLRALAFRSPAEGYAVGDRGAIARFADGAWHTERSPATERLTGVAAGRGAVVAVGAHGLLLSRTQKGWVRPAAAAALVRDTDFSAAGAASDGTLLVAAGGSILSSTGPAKWGPAPVQPLGVPVLKLSGYRTTAGVLHVVALVEQAGLRAVLDGTRAGWRPLSLGADAAVDDFALDGATKQLWLAGRRDGKAVVAVHALSSRGRQR